MDRSQKALFPGFLLGCVFLVAGINFTSEGDLFQALRIIRNMSFSSMISPIPIQNDDQAVHSSSQRNGQPVPSCPSLSKFPFEVRQWCNLIESSAARNSIEPSIVAAVILEESAGNPQAISSSGAVGLMQVMPRDGLAAGFQCVNGPCFADRPSSQQLLDPAFNIEFGSKMLGDLYRKQGNIQEALKLYGPLDVGYDYAEIVLSANTAYR
jgi:soluble lytic murein transglycosylase-like protein